LTEYEVAYWSKVEGLASVYAQKDYRTDPLKGFGSRFGGCGVVYKGLQVGWKYFKGLKGRCLRTTQQNIGQKTVK